MVSHIACGAYKAAVEKGKRERQRKGMGGVGVGVGGGYWEGRTKHYLTDRSKDALSGVNYQLLQGEVACVDGD